jgi:mRNA interferase YafQ
MKYAIERTTQFKKSFKRCVKRGLDISLFYKVITLLGNDGKLPAEYKAHKLSGNFVNCWECHISSDWLLVWQQNDKELVLLLIETGSHSDIFG